MVLFILRKRKLILQTRIAQSSSGLDVWFLVGPFVYFHTLCVWTAKALVRLRRCAGSPEPLLIACVISTIISRAGSIDEIVSQHTLFAGHIGRYKCEVLMWFIIMIICKEKLINFISLTIVIVSPAISILWLLHDQPKYSHLERTKFLQKTLPPDCGVPLWLD